MISRATGRIPAPYPLRRSLHSSFVSYTINCTRPRWEKKAKVWGHCLAFNFTICSGFIPAMQQAFRETWLERFGLSSAKWKIEAKKHLSQMPLFLPLTESISLISTLFEDVPRLLARRQDSETRQIAEAFAWCC